MLKPHIGGSIHQVLPMESKTDWSRGQTHPRPGCGYSQLVNKSKFAVLGLLYIFFSRCPAAFIVCAISLLHVHQRSPSSHLVTPDYIGIKVQPEPDLQEWAVLLAVSRAALTSNLILPCACSPQPVFISLLSQDGKAEPQRTENISLKWVAKDNQVRIPDWTINFLFCP